MWQTQGGVLGYSTTPTAQQMPLRTCTKLCRQWLCKESTTSKRDKTKFTDLYKASSLSKPKALAISEKQMSLIEIA